MRLRMKRLRSFWVEVKQKWGEGGGTRVNEDEDGRALSNLLVEDWLYDLELS